MSVAAQLPRYPLAFLPTPLHPLPRLSEQLRSQLPATSFQLQRPALDQAR